MSQDAFTTALGAVFEHTPAIATQTWHHRPFATVIDLHRQMIDIVMAMTPAQQIALIQAHPDLGSKAQMADASIQEQSGAGLDCLTADEFQQFQHLNRIYREKFNFPFIIAVREHTKASILSAFEQRLTHTLDQERKEALTEIAKITHFRLIDWVES